MMNITPLNFSRPTTSNPKRRTTQNSPLHTAGSREGNVGKLSSPRDHVSSALSSPTPEGVARLVTTVAGTTASVDLNGEVLWSDEPGSDISPAILARPHTSNPRYVELNLRDTPRRAAETGAGANASAGGSGSPTSGGQPHTVSPSATGSDGGDAAQATVQSHASGVLWASESEAVDPSLLTRPVTANPWLQRLFESGEIPDLNWTRKESQILWSSIDVNDWRMLARPHASNPLMERNIVEDGKTGSAMTPTVAHKQSEVLWQRDDDDEFPDEFPIPTTAEGNCIRWVDQNCHGVGHSVVNGLEMVVKEQSQTIRGLSDQVSGLHTTIGTLTETVNVLVGQIQSLALLNQNMMQAWNRSGNHPLQSGLSSEVPSVWAPSLPSSNDIRPKPPQNAEGAGPLLTAAQRPLISSKAGSAQDLSYVADPSPLTTTIPVVREHYPAFHPPSPPKYLGNSGSGVAPSSTVVTGGNVTPQQGDLPTPQLPPSASLHLNRSDKRAQGGPDDDDFVQEDTSGPIEPRLEGERYTRAVNASPSTQRPMSAQGSSSVASRRVQELRSAVESGNGRGQKVARPQSAPLHSYTEFRTGGARGNRSQYWQQTVCFSKDASNSLLLNPDAIVEQYDRLLRPSNEYVLKSDFSAMYAKKAEEFGMVLRPRELEDKLQQYHSVGRDVLSREEFSVLYLHIAQW